MQTLLLNHQFVEEIALSQPSLRALSKRLRKYKKLIDIFEVEPRQHCDKCLDIGNMWSDFEYCSGVKCQAAPRRCFDCYPEDHYQSCERESCYNSFCEDCSVEIDTCDGCNRSYCNEHALLLHCPCDSLLCDQCLPRHADRCQQANKAARTAPATAFAAAVVLLPVGSVDATLALICVLRYIACEQKSAIDKELERSKALAESLNCGDFVKHFCEKCLKIVDVWAECDRCFELDGYYCYDCENPHQCTFCDDSLCLKCIRGCDRCEWDCCSLCLSDHECDATPLRSQSPERK